MRQLRLAAQRSRGDQTRPSLRVSGRAAPWRRRDSGGWPPEAGRQQVGAAWGDSWHQRPALLSLHGTVADRTLELTADYGGGWLWVISLAGAGRHTLVLTMHNVVPAEHATDDAPAGPYVVMRAEFQPAR